MTPTIQAIILGLLGIALSYWMTANAHGHLAIGAIGVGVSLLYVVVELIKGKRAPPRAD